MSGSSPSGEMTLQAEAQNRQRMAQAYGIGIPALQTRGQMVAKALETGGEPDYIRRAYEAVRGGERESLGLAQENALRAGRTQNRRAIASGNLGAMTPEDYGAKMAGALYGNRVQEAMGNVEQLNKLYGFGLGQAQQAGSAALGATANELRDISGMRNYNATYAGILGALNAGGAIYGAGQQGGWWGGGDPYASAINPQTGYAARGGWQGFGGGVGQT